MNKLSLFQEDGGAGVSIDLNDRVECVLLNEFIPSTPTDEGGTVTDQCQVQLRGVNGRLTAAEINRMFQFAREKPAGGQAVFLNFAVHENEVVYRTRVVDGTISIEQGYSKGYKTGRLVITIAFEHLPYWEGPEEQIPLSNVNGTGNLTGLKVFSCNDLIGTAPNKRCNYIDIAAGFIKGELPSPVRLNIKNTTTTSGDNHDWIGHVWVGENLTNPAGTKWHYEGEAAVESSGTTGTWSLASGGAYKSGSLAAGVYPPAVYSIAGKWPITAAELTAFSGQRVRLLLVPAVIAPDQAYDVLYQIVVGDFESEWVKPNRTYSVSCLELFDFKLPSYLEGIADLKNATLELRVRNSRADKATTWSIDFFSLIPADGWIHAAPISNTMLTNNILVLDGIRKRNYVADATDKEKISLHLVVGDSLTLKPGKAHRFYFIMHNIYGLEFRPEMNASITASYRPRRASL
jgi:hypothetical protein